LLSCFGGFWDDFYYSGKRTEEFCPDLPPGIVTYGERRVQSVPLAISGTVSTCYISGRFDIVAELDNGSFAVMDFKTGNPSDEKSEMYSRQLHAYAFALENPADGVLKLNPVSKLGLLYFTPDVCQQLAADRQVLEGQLKWVEVERDDSAFISFVEEVVKLLDGPLPEARPDTCDWCKYRGRTEMLGVAQGSSSTAVREASVPWCPLCNRPMKLKTGKYGEFWSCLDYPSCKGTRNP
jgi:hypothetical protein